MRSIRPLTAFVLTLLFCLLPSFNVGAQERSVEVLRRDAEIRILANGDVQIVETWETRFNGGPFKLAYRSIPQQGLSSISAWAVSESGRAYRAASDQSPYSFNAGSENGVEFIQWYFPETSNQTRTFTLSYTVQGALRQESAGGPATLWWIHIEPDRQYTIQSATVRLRLPQSVPVEQITAEVIGGGAALVSGPGAAEFRGGPFAPGEQWEVRLRFPAGGLPALPVRTEAKAGAADDGLATWALAGLGAALAAGAGLLGLASRRIPKPLKRGEYAKDLPDDAKIRRGQIIRWAGTRLSWAGLLGGVPGLMLLFYFNPNPPIALIVGGLTATVSVFFGGVVFSIIGDILGGGGSGGSGGGSDSGWSSSSDSSWSSSDSSSSSSDSGSGGGSSGFG